MLSIHMLITYIYFNEKSTINSILQILASLKKIKHINIHVYKKFTLFNQKNQK